jgi:preprotein translocase subunit SecE
MTGIATQRTRWDNIGAAIKGTPEFLREVRAELSKVTWPDWPQLKQATITIVIFVLLIAGFIALMDLALQAVLVGAIPKLFGA